MRVAGHQVVGAAQVVAGITLVVRPAVALSAFTAPETTAARRVARVLGARLTVQGLVVGLTGKATVINAGCAVDVVHALSMLALAVRSARWRRAATASALFAGTAALASRPARQGPTPEGPG